MDVFFLVSRIGFVAALLFVEVVPELSNFGRAALRRTRQRAQRTGKLDMVGPLMPLAVAGCVLVGFGLLADLGAVLIAAFLILATPLEHAFWHQPSRSATNAETGRFWRNVAFLFGAAFVFYIYNQLGDDAGFSLSGPLFN
jgi:uncharacterized membrane protein YphA (DoxX/SURF4 family)